ncbi:hypothetical protein [Thiorhodovibrio winogradskyi]|nr:hypothetical protein [Thiorhodovibrio winogradskyi]
MAPPAMAEDGRGGTERMAEAMTRMMEAFGFGDSWSPSDSQPGQGLDDAMPDMMNPRGVGWAAGFGDPVREFGLPGPLQQFGRALGALQPTSLDGIWEGRDGGLLIVRGSRFRLYQLNAGFIDGLIQERGQRIALYDPNTDSARPYEFALQSGRLALRDAAGKVYLYRRLWLEKDLPNDSFSQPGPATDALK